MPRLSITLTDEQNDRIEELVESGEYSSKDAVVQDWLTRTGEKVNQLESDLERCRRARRQLLKQREENKNSSGVPKNKNSSGVPKASARVRPPGGERSGGQPLGIVRRLSWWARSELCLSVAGVGLLRRGFSQDANPRTSARRRRQTRPLSRPLRVEVVGQ